MLRAHKIKLNPTKEQDQYLLATCGTARFCYNWGLEHWVQQYEAGEKPSAYALKKQFNAIRRERFPWTYNVSKVAVDTGFRNLDRAFGNFFRRCKSGKKPVGYPRFKSRKRSKLAFGLDRSRFKLDGHWLKIQRLASWINMTEILRFEGDVSSLTISRDRIGHWYASFLVDVELPDHGHEVESVGVDLGLKTLAMLSDGTQFENQKLLRSELCKLGRLNRELARRQKGSRHWYHTKHKLAVLHNRIKNQRLDYTHKMTTQIARRYRIIGIENLNVSGMVRNHKLALSISDASFGEIRRQLEYKAEWYGGVVVSVDRFFPSSKLCYRCGQIKSDLVLADRVFVCDCGHVEDRDLNAARNIETKALSMVAVVATSRPKTRVDGNVRPVAASQAVLCEA